MRVPRWARRPRTRVVQKWIISRSFTGGPSELIPGAKDTRIVQLRRTAGTWRNERRS